MKKYAIYFLMVSMSVWLCACSSAGSAGQNNAQKEEASSAESAEKTSEENGSTENGSTEEQAEVVLPPDNYPTKNIEFIVPAAAGATLDLLVRGLNDSGLDLGKPIAITNMAGASQTLGLAEVAARKADGYTLTCAGAAGTLVQPLLLDLTYSMEDFRYLSMLNGPVPNAVAVSATSGYQSWEELRKKMEAGETLYYTSANTGSVGHVAALKMMSQISAPSTTYVSYNGSAEAAAALLSGDVDFLINDVDLMMEREKEGQFKCLLTLSDERSPFAPEVPAAKEVGIEGMGNFVGTTYIMIDAETPEEIVKYVKQQIDAAVGSEKYAEFMKSINKAPTPVVTEKELTDILYKAREAYREVVGQIGQ